MAKWISVFLRTELRMIKPLLYRLSLKAARKDQDRIGRLGSMVLKDKVHFEPLHFEHFQADWAVPLNTEIKGAILYLHGGGYVMGSLAYARGFGGELAAHTGRKTLCMGYRLAPEDPFPAALDDTIEAYRTMLKEFAAEEIAFVGESAGGGLCYCAVQKIRQLGLPMPACITGISPWTDLTLSGKSYKENARKDPSLLEKSLKYYARLYAGDDRKNPLVSPAFGDFTGFPPSLVYAGTYEILRDDSQLLADRLAACGASCELHLIEGMWHVFVLFGIPEAKEALTRIVEFIGEHAK